MLCKLCPNECLLGPEDRSHCRNRVNKGGVLYTLAYGNAASFQVDPIEKKPLYHFLPGSDAFSFAAGGCGFRCLNRQNWDISQRKPEELKDPRGEPVNLRPENFFDQWTREDIARLSLMPQDAVDLAGHLASSLIAYTYSEPIAWYEYLLETARLARQAGVKNLWVTCGYIQQQPLVELCRVIDAASVNLKGFDDEIYRQLNSGTLAPVLATLKTLARQGVWTEVINLVVPSYTDKPQMMRPMCRLGGGEPGTGLSLALFPLPSRPQARPTCRPLRSRCCWKRGTLPAAAACATCTSATSAASRIPTPRSAPAASGRWSSGTFFRHRDGRGGRQVQVLRDEDRRGNGCKLSHGR